jgi:hypothetical protein
LREPWVSWFGAINRFVARQTPIANPASGPPTQSTSSPLSNAGSKRCRANGVGLLTVPGISRIDRGEWEKIGIGRAAAQSVQPLETAIIHQKSPRGRFARSDRDCVMNSRRWVVRFDFSMSAACPVRVPALSGDATEALNLAPRVSKLQDLTWLLVYLTSLLVQIGLRSGAL